MKTKGSRNKKGVGRVMSLGYYEVFEPNHPLAKKNGYVKEHRKIAYDAGLLTDPSMEVHHKNGNKLDNRRENLELMSASDHQSITNKGRKQTAEWVKKRITKTADAKRGKKYPKNIYENPELLTPQ